jgi:hypothetical protein
MAKCEWRGRNFRYRIHGTIFQRLRGGMEKRHESPQLVLLNDFALGHYLHSPLLRNVPYITWSTNLPISLS